MLRALVALMLVTLTLPALAGTRVVASIYPLAMVSAAVARPDTEVKLLISTSATTHDYQLNAGDLKALAEADVVVWAGPESEPYLAGALERPRPGQRVITLSKLPGVVVREQRLDPADLKTFGRDPHLWLSTRNAALLARALGAHLGNALAAEHFDAEMQRFRARQQKRFAPVARVPLLAAHDAYGYLFDEIGLLNASAVLIDPASQASARRVADLAERVEKEHIGCMIGEPGFETTIGPRIYPSGHGNLVVIDPQLAGINLARNSYTLALTYLADTLYNCIVTR